MIVKSHKKEKGLSLVVFALGLGALLGFAALAIDLGIANNIQNELQKATTTAALVGALEMEPNELGVINQTQARQATLAAFQQAVGSIPMLNTAVLVEASTGNTSINDPLFVRTTPSSRAVSLQARAQVPTYFMAVIGITSLQVNAQAAAISCPAYPARNLPPPAGSVIASVIKDPVGGVNANVFKAAPGSPADASFILGPPDNVPVALGAGGSVTLRMPAPIVDGPGDDIYVRELGDLEGYYLYVGIEDGGGNIIWNNVSCTGKPSENVLANAGAAAGAYHDDQGHYKFYGSGLFDLAKTCTSADGNGIDYAGNVKNATYIYIKDDNSEDGILASDLVTPTILLGEHSSSSPGADIDTVAVLHHSRIVDYNAGDKDNDGLIDAYEYLLGTNENNADTDGDGISDGDEISGAKGFITNSRVADTDGDGVNDLAEINAGTNPLMADKDK